MYTGLAGLLIVILVSAISLTESVGDGGPFSSDKFAEPITTAPPQGDNLGTASLTAIEGETHNPQTQTGSTDEVWQSHRNACVDAWAGAASGGSFRDVALVAVWGLWLMMHRELVD